MLSLTSLLSMFLLFSSCGGGDSATTDNGSPKGDNSDKEETVSALDITKKLGWGWNLGNHFDTSTGQDNTPYQWGYWDNATTTAQLYTRLKSAGVSTVRIPVTWGNNQTPGNWTIKSSYMAEVKKNVEWAEAAGLNVILNIHHDGYWLKIKEAANDEKMFACCGSAFPDGGILLQHCAG